MILNHYIKTGLATLAALLCVGGGNAYAADDYTQVYTRTATSWTEADKAEWGGNSNLTVDATYGLGFNTTNPGTSYSATKTFDISNNAKVKYSITWRTGNATGRNTNYEYLQIGNIRISYNSYYKFYLDTDGKSSMTTEIAKMSNSVFDIPVELVYNTATKTVESLSFNGTDITSKVSGTIDGDFKAVTFGFERGGKGGNWAYPNYLTNITVSQLAQSVTTASYTINYTHGGKTLKTVTGETAVGATVSADKAIEVDGTRYILEATEVPSMTITASDNTLNVPVRKPYTATLNVTTNINGTATTATTAFTETDDHVATWAYAFPIYAKGTDGVYYKADATTFGESGTFTDGETISKTVNYTTADNDVIFFSEGESTPGTDFLYSNGATGYVAYQNARDRGISVGTLEAGKYSFDVVFTGVHKRSLGIRHATDDPLVIIQPTAVGESTAEFTLDSTTTNLFINGANYGTAKVLQSEDFDYVVIRRINTISAEINATSNLTSFCSTSTVTVPDDVTIYIATASDDNSVTLNSVDTKVIPAGTGVILYSAESGTKTLTVSGTADESLYASNILKAATSAVTAGDNTYALVKGQQAFAKVSAGITIPAGKAYLETTANGKLNISFGGATTGISNFSTEVAADSNAPMYNLAGQRVNSSYKGVIIKNGRKFLNK